MLKSFHALSWKLLIRFTSNLADAPIKDLFWNVLIDILTNDSSNVLLSIPFLLTHYGPVILHGIAELSYNWFRWGLQIPQPLKLTWKLLSDIIISALASQITGVSIVCSTICSGIDQRKHQCSASLAFVWGIHRWLVDSPHKGPMTWKMFPFDDAIMKCPRGQWGNIFAVPYEHYINAFLFHQSSYFSSLLNIHLPLCFVFSLMLRSRCCQVAWLGLSKRMSVLVLNNCHNHERFIM